jgi:hypothetical protein
MNRVEGKGLGQWSFIGLHGSQAVGWGAKAR